MHVVEVLHAARPGGGRVNIAAESSEIVTILLLAHDEVSDGRSLRLGERPGSVVRIKTFIIGRSALCKANSLSPHPSSPWPWPGPTIPVEAVVPVAVHAAAAEDGVVVGPGLPPEAGLQQGEGHETKVTRRFVITEKALEGVLVESGYYHFHIEDTIKKLC